MRTQKERKIIATLSILVAILLSLVYWWYAITRDIFASAGYNKNTIAFGLLIIIFCAFTLMFYLIFLRVGLPYRYLDKGRYVILIAGVLVIAWLCVPFAVYVGGNQALFIRGTITFIGLGIFWLLQKNKPEYAKVIVGMVILLGMILWAVCNCSFTPIYSGYDTHHTAAYVDSIYNVARGIPYYGGLTDQYGHYGLLYGLILGVWGYTTRHIVYLIVALTVFVYIGMVWVMCTVVKSDILRVFGVITISMFGVYIYTQANYWQGLPHRLVFPIAVLILIAFFNKRRIGIPAYVAGGVVCLLGFIWNFESGLVSVAAWSIFLLFRCLQSETFCVAEVFKRIIWIVCTIILSFGGAWGIVNIWNTVHGGSALAFNAFLGAVIDSNYRGGIIVSIVMGEFHSASRYLYHACSFFMGGT